MSWVEEKVSNELSNFEDAVKREASNLEDEVRSLGRSFEEEIVEDLYGGWERYTAAPLVAAGAAYALPAIAAGAGSVGSGLMAAGQSAMSGLGSLGSGALAGLEAAGVPGIGEIASFFGAQGGIPGLGGEQGGLLGGLGNLIGLASDYYTGDKTKDAVREASQLQAQMYERGIASAEAAQARLEAGLAPFAQFGVQALEPLAAQTSQEKPLNPLLQRASDLSMQGSQQFLSPEILENPLLKALQSDVTNRLMANQAARGKLGSGGTAKALQEALVPQAIQFGLQQAGLQQQDIANLQALGATQEDLGQRGIENLFRSAGIGQASAAQTGLSGVDTASTVGGLSGQLGGALAFDPLGRAQARNQQIGGLQSFLER